MFQLLSRRLHDRRRGFTLIELVVAMAVVLILGSVAYATYIGQVANARTAALDELMQQVYTGMISSESASATGAFPTDSANVAATANTGATSWAGLVTDLATAGASNLPPTTAAANIITSSWTYEPINTTTPATFTIVAQATGGNTHVLCMDPIHGTVDLGAAGTPTTVGVTCK
ncbi:MAG TPA: type II secretion system protein [bacterium]|nr:type II secretion system protein [bacterium]